MRPFSRLPVLLAPLAALCLLTPAPAAAAPAVDYADPANWLCRPGRSDICAKPLTSTVLSATDASLTKKTYAPDPAAPIDCFYVYPTVSQELSANADLTAGPEVQHVAAEQFARFGAACRTFAPIYRQTTVAAMTGRATGADAGLAYQDVRDAWRAYLARDNHGRGVVLVGHSQGAYLLTRLIAEEIDGKPIARQIVSAIVPGGAIQVPAGKDVGGSFHHIALCRSADQTGCVIAYSTYLADAPPGPDAHFGRSAGPGLNDACVNPAELTGHGALDGDLPAVGRVAAVLGTDFVENPGVVSAACVTAGDRSFLAITVRPLGARAATLAKAMTDLDGRAPGWGLHALDVNLALGDLVETVGREAKAWTAAHH